ncbi:hypothetical protein HHI36_009081 [Cryptolaemus montrouzieri]|uniref:Kinase n=1 Tax=Cryptolaemus montrouzieri TaxID=559131 RepID=A0ABD2MUT4_9CUCU
MVYLLAEWGMGENDLRCRNYSDQQTDLQRRLSEQFDQEEVDLHPLSNQVGGHTRLMVLNPGTICKPLNYRELDFYQNIQDQDIKMFVPKYKGKLSIISQKVEPNKDSRIRKTVPSLVFLQMYSTDFQNEIIVIRWLFLSKLMATTCIK